MNPEVICVGSATLDTIAVVPALPGADGRVVASSFVVAGGGPAATAAVALARLGVRVGFCGVVGDDAAGAEVRAGLEREGVDTDWIVTRSGWRTAQSVIVVSESSADRMIITEAAREVETLEVPIGRSAWLHVDHAGIAPVRRALADSGTSARVSVDGGNPIHADDLAGVELYAPTVQALRERYPVGHEDGALRAALLDGAQTVVATDGARGAVVARPGEEGYRRVDAFRTLVVSTLGAGDVFHGALLAGLVHDLPLQQAAREASAAAALSCRAIDGRSAIPTRGELDEFLTRNPQALARSGA